jgi:hypothetical protein
MDIQAIKVQFPEVKFWMFVGRSAGKRIKGQMFPKDVAVPVWDRKTQILLKRLPYMKLVDEALIAKGAVRKAEPERKAVDVPDQWWNLHHKRRMAIARGVSNEDILTVARADEILNARKPKPIPAPEPQPVETPAAP